MKKLYLLIFALGVLSQASAQQGALGIWDLFSESYPMPADYKTLNVGQKGSYTVSAAILQKTFASQFPEQKCGPLKIFALNFLMGNPYRWEVNVNGNIFPYDVKIMNDHSTIVTGAFVDSFHVGNYSFQSNQFIASSFVMSIDVTGEINWITLLQDSIFNTLATTITSIESGNIVVAGLTSDIESSIWKFNPQTGQLLSSKTFEQVRTFSSIIEVNNALYIAGSSGDLSKIDTFTIQTALNTGYVNFLAKLDTNFLTINLKCKPYITFDFTSQLELNSKSKNILWGYFFQSNTNQFKQGFDVINSQDNLVLHYEAFPQQFLDEFDNRLMVPTLNSGLFYVLRKLNNNYYAYDLGTSGIDSARIITNSQAKIYDVGSDSENGFTTVGVFTGDSLRTNINTLFNPYVDSAMSQNFLSHYQELILGIEDQNRNEIKVYPNPANDVLSLALEDVLKVDIFTLQGKLIDEQYNTNRIYIHQLPAGMYLLKANTSFHNYVVKFIKR